MCFWVTKSGEKILVSDMETSHLINSYNCLRKSGFVSEKVYNRIFNNRENLTEGQFNLVMKKPVSKLLSIIENELSKRNITF